MKHKRIPSPGSQGPDGLSQSDIAFFLVVVIIIGLCLESWLS